jgi:DNA-binding winged helix-turn-helix (wHTH) protein/tetratricopeptide (TPR) repeat protein
VDTHAGDRTPLDACLQAVWLFREFRLEAGERRLSRNGASVPLAPKAFDLLLLLVERQGSLVRKDEIMRGLWPGTFVESGTLARHVSELRRTLGDKAERDGFIQTIPKSGYRFQGTALRETRQSTAGFRPGALNDSRDSAACEMYLRGRFFWARRTEQSLKKALVCFTAAVQWDDSYAAAHAARGDVLGLLAGYGLPPETCVEALSAASRALLLDPASADAHAALGVIAQKYERDWDKAGREYRQALQLRPDHTTALHRYGELLALLGRFEQGIAHLSRARALDPVSLIIGSDLAKAFFFARKYDLSIQEARSVLDLDSTFVRARLYLGLSLLFRGDLEVGLEEIAAAAQTDTSSYTQGVLGYAQAMAGNRTAARDILSRFQGLDRAEFVTPHALALTHLGLGEHEKALDYFERMSAGGYNLVGLGVSPLTDVLQAKPRFRHLLDVQPAPS